MHWRQKMTCDEIMEELKELESLIKAEGRGRLISSNSQMGKE